MDRIITAYRKVVHLRPAGFWPGFIAGLIYFSYIFWWFWSLRPTVLLGIGNNILAFIIILVPFVMTVLGASMFWGLFTYAIGLLKNTRIVVLPILTASVFVLLEYLRTWFIGILWLGENSLLGAHWTMGNPAYLLVGSDSIRRLASYAGIYGIDFFIIFLGTAIFLFLKPASKNIRTAPFLEILLLIALPVLINFTSSAKSNQLDENKLIVSIIQTKNPTKVAYEPNEFLSDFGEKNKLLKETSRNSDMVIFPETTNFSKTLSGFLKSDSAQKYFSGLSSKSILVIDNIRIPEERGLKSKAILIDSKEGIVGSYDKKLLTPGGEYLPYILKLPLLVFERLFKNNFITSGAVFVSGIESGVISHRGEGIKFLICSDILSPGISREGGFDFIAGMDNLAIFGGNRLIERELLSAARFRAAENGKFLALASNFGRSYIINPLGAIFKSTDSSGYQILTADIVSNVKRTWYNRLGDWPILLASLLIFILGLIRYRNIQ